MKIQRDFSMKDALSTDYHAFKNKYYNAKSNLITKKEKKRKESNELLEKLENKAKSLGHEVESTRDGSAFQNNHYIKKEPFSFKFNWDSGTSDNRGKILDDRHSRVGKIQFNEKDSAATFAHELGHAYDYSSPGGQKRFNDRLRAELDAKDRAKGLHSIQPKTKSYELNLSHEGQASANAIKLLKKQGASPEELRLARKQLKSCLGTYYEAHRNGLSYGLIDEYGKEKRNAYKTAKKAIKAKYKKELDRISRQGLTKEEKALDKNLRNAKAVALKLKRKIVK